MRIRFSIKGLMIATAFASVAFAGFIYPNPILAASVYTGAFVIILCGIPAAALGNDRVRAYWIGFTICGAGFFALATLDEIHDPLQAAHVQREPSLITSHFLLRANEYRPIFRTANSTSDSPHMYSEGVIRIGAKLYAVRDDAANFVRIGNAE